MYDDIVAHNFTTDRSNALWLTDITEHQTDQGKRYVCAIKDVYSNRIVGYSIDSRMKRSLAAVRNAITPKAFVRTLENNGLIGSMGRVGACGDNGATESFFIVTTKNVIDR